jgi:tungstate transport system substrate-binding protein
MSRKLLVIVFVAIVLTQCTREEQASRQTFVVASTTSTQDAGLLDALTPAFERANPHLRTKVVAVGSGEAMELGRRGDADVLLVHSPKDEEQFMQEGRGLSRTPVMSNDFVIAGPTSDSAEIRSSPNGVEAFTRIAGTQSLFLSRGDESGTHRRELDLWKRAGIVPRGRWYLSSGQGMAETLMIASEKRAYVLTDTATFKVVQGKAGITTLFSGDEILVNPYSVIPVMGSRKGKAAQVFAEWISGPEGQDFIGAFGKDRFGSPLFEPAGAST